MKRTICIILILAFAVLFGTSVYFIFDYYRQAEQQEELYESLVSIVESAADTEEPTKQIQYSAEKTLLPELAEIYQKNNDLVGWISIADTNINYPVMQSVKSPDFYLNHSFDKEYSDYGCPYVQENCNVQNPSDNVIIYGHHMKNGSMFADLKKFKNQDFWQEHKTLSFNTLTDKYEYEIVAVFKTFVYSDSPDSFKFYQFVNAETPKDFTAYIGKCKELSLYDTGVSVEYGDKLITLSTCDYSYTNGRIAVVTKRIQPSKMEVGGGET